MQEEQQHEVERIIGKAVIEGVEHYQVMWKGGDESWEPRDNLEGCLAMIRDFENGGMGSS
jgi:hypothetical protein